MTEISWWPPWFFLHGFRDDLWDPINTVCTENCFCNLYQLFTLQRQIIFGLKHQAFPQSKVRLWGDLIIMCSKSLVFYIRLTNHIVSLNELHWQLSWKCDIVQEQSTSLEIGNILSPPQVMEGSLRTKRHQEKLLEVNFGIIKKYKFQRLLACMVTCPVFAL